MSSLHQSPQLRGDIRSPLWNTSTSTERGFGKVFWRESFGATCCFGVTLEVDVGERAKEEDELGVAQGAEDEEGVWIAGRPTEECAEEAVN